MAKEGYAFLNIYSPMPNFLSEVNADILSEVSRFQMESIKDYRERQNKGLIKWNISSVPNLVWANSLDMDINHLWELILDICLINEENIKLKQSFTINIVDTTAPVIWLGNSYTVSLGSKDTMLEKILCGDNYDANPTCEIIGEYDMNVAGTYPLTFKATDSSGNVTEKDFNLNVKKPVPNTGNNTTNNNTPAPKTNFSDVIANYKNANTEIGLDISEWQGVVDFNKLKEAGVEFVFLRVGGTKGITGDYFLDSKFEDNIKKANEAGMPVGIYFYSYANSKEKAIKDAKWILEQIKDYKIDLPIAFDWENWSFYNEFNLSFFGLTDMANAFLDTFKDAGYQGLLYSSKTYLENIWQKTDYPVWLAHYAKSTSYKGEFEFWQICSNGRVDGINGDVDINIRYKK
jgi:GH25 family lysozyme M1 (1,4-beta-N-acetylmuramidase)